MRSLPLMKLNGFYSGIKEQNTYLVILRKRQSNKKPLTLIISGELHKRHDEGIERMNQRKKPR